MNQRKEEDTTEADFIIRSYTNPELAQLYCRDSTRARPASSPLDA